MEKYQLVHEMVISSIDRRSRFVAKSVEHLFRPHVIRIRPANWVNRLMMADLLISPPAAFAVLCNRLIVWKSLPFPKAAAQCL